MRIALALQCLQASKQALVVSQQTKIGASERLLLSVHGGLVNWMPQLQTGYSDFVLEALYLTFVIQPHFANHASLSSSIEYSSDVRAHAS